MADVKYIGIRMPQELVGKMERVLTGESLGITEYIRALVREDLRKRGMLNESSEQEHAPQPTTSPA